jgi:hypothetical protein
MKYNLIISNSYDKCPLVEMCNILNSNGFRVLFISLGVGNNLGVNKNVFKLWFKSRQALIEMKEDLLKIISYAQFEFIFIECYEDLYLEFFDKIDTSKIYYSTNLYVPKDYKTDIINIIRSSPSTTPEKLTLDYIRNKKLKAIINHE